MKKLILNLILLTYCFVSFSQNNPTFFVEYVFEQKQISTSLSDSVKEKKVPTRVIYITKGDTTKIDTVEGTMKGVGKPFDFAASFYMIRVMSLSNFPVRANRH